MMTAVNESLFVEDAEREYYTAIQAAEHYIATSPLPPLSAFLNAFATFIVPITNRFFTEVLIISEDVTLRHNRLALCQRVVNLGSVGVDWSKLKGF